MRGVGLVGPGLSGVGSPGSGDTTPPGYSAITVTSLGLTIEFDFDEAMDQTSTPATGDFSLAGTFATFASFAWSSSTKLVGTLATTALIWSGATVTVSYTPGANPIRDLAHNNAAALSGAAVTNASNRTPLTIVTSVTCRWWYDATQGLTLAGSAVTQWNDLSGNGAHLTQSTAGSKPTYNATGGPNSLPVVQFDGTDDYMANTVDLPAPGTTAFFCCSIASQDTWTDGDIITASATTNAYRLRQKVGGASPQVEMANTTAANGNGAWTLAAFRRICQLFTNSTGDILQVGSSSQTGANAGNTNPAAGWAIGASPTGGAPSDVNFSENVAWAGNTTAGEKTEMDKYFYGRWGSVVMT